MRKATVRLLTEVPAGVLPRVIDGAVVIARRTRADGAWAVRPAAECRDCYGRGTVTVHVATADGTKRLERVCPCVAKAVQNAEKAR